MNFKIKIIISILLFVIIIGLVAGLVIIPTIHDIKKISNAIYAERVDLEKKYLRGQLLKKTVNDFEEIKPQKDKLNTVFIPQGNELKFISTLEDVASTNGVKQNLELNTQSTTKTGDLQVLPIKMTIQGNFYQIMKYLTGLEKLNYYLNITNLQFNAEKDSITATLYSNAFTQSNTEKK
ncbi:MAG: type 4a pilus biogenesis protein PilO [Patescibacteria group bacterium]